MPLVFPLPYAKSESSFDPTPDDLYNRTKELTYGKCILCQDLIDFTECGAIIQGTKVAVPVSVVFMSPDDDQPLCSGCVGEHFNGKNEILWTDVPLEIFQALVGPSDGLEFFTEIQSRRKK